MTIQLTVPTKDTNASAWDRVKDAFKRDWEQTKNDVSRTHGQKLNQGAGDTIKQITGSEPVPIDGVKTHPTDPKVAASDAEKARVHMAKESVKASRTIGKAHDDIANHIAARDKQVENVHKDLAIQNAKASDQIADAREKAAVVAVKHVEKIGEAGAKLDAKIAEVQKGLAAQQTRAGEKIAHAQAAASAGATRENVKVVEAIAKREDAVAEWEVAEAEARFGFLARSSYSAAAWDDTLEGKLSKSWDALATGRSWPASRAGVRRGWDYAAEKR